MSTKFLTLTLLGGFICLSSPQNISAATIGPRCGSCYGTTSTITETAEYVRQVAVKISRNNLVSVPGGVSWKPQSAILSGIGCSGVGANIICASPAGSVYSWVFDIPKKGTISNTESIRANYDTADVILSDVTPRPRPGR